MIIKILLFFLCHLYGSTPNPTSKIDALSQKEDKIIEGELNNPSENSNYDNDANKRLDVMLNFIEKNFNTIWNKLIETYENNPNYATQNRENIFKQAYGIPGELEYSMRKNIKIKNKLLEQLNIAKGNKKFNHAASSLIEETEIDFLCSFFDAFVNSWNTKIFFSDYIIDFSDEEDNKNTLPQRFSTFLPQNFFHRYFTPFEVLTFSSFLIKKFVKPSLTKKFLNNYFGSNFTKKQGVRYLEKYLLSHSGKFFIGVVALHGLYKVIEPVKKELNKFEKIEF